MDKQSAKDMYIKGYSVTDIAKTHGVTRQTIYKKKAKDKEAGIDWDALVLAKNRDAKSTKASEDRFISTLIESFERAFEEIKQLEPNEQLEILSNYTETYYKLKAPLKTDHKAVSIEAAQKAINEIVVIAEKSKNDAVTDFLSKNADEILGRIFKK
ncbi:DUF1804 family protein [Campylobacter sp. RM9328]|uniref:DUF1804 family protein n=1 Tax=Campylobacter sp. RM9328 TaxID=1705720 RepID=UPI00147567A3|nr:DUF1804 family protein [Campylobacter sp. RM9328]